MNERIKLVRKKLKLTQTELGEKIGVKIGVIRNFETNKTTLTSPLFELFCNTFNVNPDWLRTGNGDMFVSDEFSIVDKLQYAYELSDTSAEIIAGFLKLPKSEQDSFMQTLKKIVEMDL